ncbi:MAG TPA: transcriptional repressor [Nitrospiraceae bacterium]|nr:transcriptional repressor [Nitrospiraceae bacterium]
MKSKEIRTQIITKLRERGFKLTPQRIEIIYILSSDKSHPSANDLLLKARERNPKISMSTVYYTLNLLKREGLIMEIDFYDKSNRYDSNVSDHLNLICMQCGKIEDFEDLAPVSFEEIEKTTGFKTFDTRFEYHGYCKECKQKRR